MTSRPPLGVSQPAEHHSARPANPILTTFQSQPAVSGAAEGDEQAATGSDVSMEQPPTTRLEHLTQEAPQEVPSSSSQSPAPLEVQEPPSDRGLPALFFHTFHSFAQESGAAPPSEDGGDVQDGYGNSGTLTTSPVPFAPRLTAFASSKPATLNPASVLGPKSDVALKGKPRAADSQSTATLQEGNDTAGSYPWCGNHSEDTLTEQVVKSGYSEKAKVVNENNTARASLWPHFKNKTGLHALSYIFTSVLKQRQEKGRVTALSTFKPPPRVTLTDTKRETWLRDLANPSVPLRRLSRSIPHGIRGQLLLDQCLTKRVPVARAVWLVKVVGANEVRAFKRRGISGAMLMGNELKWIQEWTGFVEDFVQSVLGSCGEPDWKTKINYVIQLSTRLYVERLVDVDHFLEWVLKYVETCDVDILPGALLLLRIYWKSLTANGKRGWHLTNTLLNRLREISDHVDADLLLPVMQQLRRLLKLLVTDCQSCALNPHQWLDHRRILLSMREDTDLETLALLNNVIERNDRLTNQARRSENSLSPPSTLEEVASALDNLGLTHSVDEVSSFCLSKLEDLPNLMSTLLQWASSVYYRDIRREYVAVSFVQDWRTRGLDTDTAILEALMVLKSNPAIEPERTSRVIALLIRSGCFNAGRYLQWLIATGALAGCDAQQLHNSCDIRPLIDMPVEDLPRNIVNLRRTLLRSVGIRADDEASTVEALKARIQREVPGLFGQHVNSADAAREDPAAGLSGLNFTVTSQIGAWIQHEVAFRAKDSIYDGEKFEIIATYDTFAVLRKWLEELQEFPALAELLQTMAKISDAELLITIMDTFLLHLQVFAAIDAATRLFGLLIDRYRTLRLKRPPQKDVVVRLINLSIQLSVGSQLTLQLERELLLCDQGAALAACSPVSEGNLEDAKESAADFADEIERILNTGTNIDKQTFDSVFGMITSHLQMPKHGHLQKLSTLVSSLCRLKSFDEEHFDKTIRQWTLKILLDAEQQTFEQIAPSLIGSGCLPLSCIAESVDSYFREDDARNLEVSGGLALRLLQFLFSSRPASTAVESKEQYRFKVEKKDYLSKNPSQVVQLLRHAMQQPSLSSGTSTFGQLSALISSPSMLEIARKIIRDDASRSSYDLQNLFGKSQDISAYSDILLDSLVDPSGVLEMVSLSNAAKIPLLFEIVDPFSLPFCQTTLWGLVKSIKAELPDQDNVSDLLIAAIKRSIARNCQVWPRLVMALNIENQRPIREHAEESIFALCEAILLPIASQARDDTSSISFEESLAVVGATASSIPGKGIPNVAVRLLANLKLVLQRAERGEANTEGLDTTTPDSWQPIETVIDTLLQLSITHAASFHSGKPGSADTAALLHILSNLLAASHNPAPPSPSVFSPIVQEHIFDTAAYFLSALPSASVATLTRDLAPFANNRQLRFLFGLDPTPDTWFSLSQPQPASSTPRTAATSPAAQQPAAKLTPFPLRRWELFSDAAPNAGENDTALNLRLFDARRVF